MQMTFPRMGIDRDVLRRAVIFFLDIGVPLVVGAALGEGRAALLGAVTGLLFSFADANGPLSARFLLLAMAAGGVTVGALLGQVFGQMLGGYSPVFWVAFAAVAFAAGCLSGVGKGPMMAGRLCTMAMAISAGVSVFDIGEIAAVAGALAVAVVVRAADHLLFGPLPQLGLPPRSTPATRAGWIRFALAYSVAAVIGLWIGVALDPQRAIWVTTTTLVVMAPDAQASYVRIVGRIEGAFFGAGAAWLLSLVLGTPVLICAAVLLVAPLVPHHLVHRYWLHTALIAVLILLANDLAEFGLHSGHAFYFERLQDMVLGCGLALVGTAAAFPRNSD